MGRAIAEKLYQEGYALSLGVRDLEKLQPLIENWEEIMQVKVTHLYLRSMKSRWGSCTYNKATIRLNTELAKRPLDSLEYVVVHEVVHLLEPSHNQRFKLLMTQYLPNWKRLKAELNFSYPKEAH